MTMPTNLQKIFLDNKGCYYKVCKEEHLFRKYQGFGISKTILDKCEDMPILIKYVGKDIHYYKTSVQQYRESLLVYDYFDDVQKIVPIKEMKEVKMQKKEDDGVVWMPVDEIKAMPKKQTELTQW